MSCFGLLVWLVARESPAATWLIYGAWGVAVIAVLIRMLRPEARGHRVRSGVGPALSGLDEVQSIYLGRPDVGPAAFGSAGPSTAELALDRVEPDPGDLRQTIREA